MQPGAQQISIAAFQAKFKSKKEIAVMLQVSCCGYIPDSSHLTIYFLKQLISGDKK